MANHWRKLAASSSLLLLVLLGVALAWSLLGGWVFLPQAGSLVWLGLGLALFLGAQLLIFRLLDLRSQADEQAPAERPGTPPSAEPGHADPDAAATERTAGPEGDADWRAWRG